MDEGLNQMTNDQLVEEVKKLCAGIREHRDSTGQDLCWHHPKLWSLLPEKIDPKISIPERKSQQKSIAVSCNAMKTLLIIVSYILFISCKSNKKDPDRFVNENVTSAIGDKDAFFAIFQSDTLLELYKASITLPKGWRRANDDTLPKMPDATAKYRFHNKSGKLIYLQYGFTGGNPTEPNVIPAHSRPGYLKNNLDTTDIIFSDNPGLTENRKNSAYNFSVDKVSTFEATLFWPKQTGKGYTGVYIDSIGQIAGNITDLVLFGEDLDSVENVEIRKVIRRLVLINFK